MNDEHYTPELGSWLKETDVIPPDPQTSARRIMTDLPESRQRHMFWPFRRRPTSAAASPTGAATPHLEQPRLGQSQEITITGRTRSMFSPVKAIAVGTLVFAIGGAYLVAQPIGQQTEPAPAAVSDSSGNELLFTAIDEPNSGDGEFRSYGSIPSGTLSREAGMWEPPNYAFTIVLDPAPPGGDTFAISISGQIQKQVAPEVVQSTGFWNVVAGSGTGEYAGLTGKGRVVSTAHADNDLNHSDDWGVSVLVGSLTTSDE